MKIAAIGRSGATYNAIRQLSLAGHHIVGIQTDVGYPEYDRQVHDFEVLASELGHDSESRSPRTTRRLWIGFCCFRLTWE